MLVLPEYLSGDRAKNNMCMYYVMLHICKYSSIYPNVSILSKTSVYTGISNSSPQQHRLLKLSPLVLLQSCPTLCDPMDCSPPGSSVHGILQARILEWVAMSFSKGLPDQESSCVSCWSYIAGQFFYLWPTREDHFPCLSVKFLLTMIICLCHMPYIYLFTSSTHI